MLIPIAAVILLFSFLIALISLIREQKKLNKIAAKKAHVDASDVSSTEIFQKPPEKVAPTTQFPDAEIKTVNVASEPQKVETVHVSFPWEDPNVQAPSQKLINNIGGISKEKPSSESDVLQPQMVKRGLGTRPTDLNEAVSVSLKDLADKS